MPSTAPSDSSLYLDEYVGIFAEQWDRLVGWDARTRSEGTFFVDLLLAAKVNRVLDAATGSGFHAVKLAEAGLDVTATDGAKDMVEAARKNVEERGLSVRCEVADWRELKSVVGGGFDAVICLGNSLSHIFNAKDMDETMRGFREVLNPGGLLVLDQRNYDVVLDGTLTTHRQSYCCVGKGTSVELEKLSDERVRIVYTLAEANLSHSIETFPWRRAAIQGALQRGGFEDLRIFGDFKENFDPATVDFVVHVARLGAQ